MSMTALCGSCRWYIGDLQCAAFLDGIPDDILSGEFDHEQPHDGDNGIQYEVVSIPPEVDRLAAARRASRGGRTGKEKRQVSESTRKQETWDLTVFPIGDQPLGDFYATPLSECPVCHRVGQQYMEYDSGMWLHVVSLLANDEIKSWCGPVWVSEYCNIDSNRIVISEPAATMRGKSLAERLAELAEVAKGV